MVKRNFNYVQLDDEKIKNYLASKDATEHEKEAVKLLTDQNTPLFEMKEFNNNLIVTKDIANNSIVKNLSLEKSSYRLSLALFVCSFILFLALAIGYIWSPPQYPALMILMTLASVLGLISTGIMLYGHRKNLNELKGLDVYLKNIPENNSSKSSLFIELRTFAGLTSI